MYTLTVLEKCLMDVVKTSWSEVRSLTFLGRPQDVKAEYIIHMHLSCIFFNLISSNVYLKHLKVSSCILLRWWRNVVRTSYKLSEVTSGEWHSWDVSRTTILNKFCKSSFCNISVSFCNSCNIFNFTSLNVLNTEKLVIAHSFTFGETS